MSEPLRYDGYGTSAASPAQRLADWLYTQGSRGAMVAAILIAGYAIALLTIKFNPYYAVIGMICLAFGIAVAYKPEFGALAYFAIAPLAFGESPQVESSNSDYSAGVLPAEIILGFLLMIWFARMVLTGRAKIVPSHLNKPLLTLGAVVLASLACSRFIYDPAIHQAHYLFITQVAEAGLFLLAIGAFFLTANLLKNPKWINATIYPVAAIGAYVAVFKLLDIPMIVATPKSVFVATVAAAYIFSWLLFNRPKAGATLVLVVILAGCLAVAYRSLDWISGLITITLVLLTLILFKSKKVFAGVVIALLIAAIFANPVFKSMYDESAAQGDFDRFGIWSDAANMAWQTNPILGIGPGNYYSYSFKFGSIWYGNLTYTTAHNNYAQVGAEMGLLGLFALLWVIVGGIRTGLDAFKNANPDLKWIAAAATAILVGFAASSMFGDYMFPNRANNGLFLFCISVFIWLTLGAAVAARNVSDEGVIDQAAPPLFRAKR
ncbi:MAG: O-antigen ligase family protein [Armatimonadota bacterium]|nr:O-antigen ligase family protein [Armatimonadota bacterium]